MFTLKDNSFLDFGCEANEISTTTVKATIIDTSTMAHVSPLAMSVFKYIAQRPMPIHKTPEMEKSIIKNRDFLRMN